MLKPCPGEGAGHIVYARGLPDDRDFGDVVASGRFVDQAAVEAAWAEALRVYRADRMARILEPLRQESLRM